MVLRGYIYLFIFRAARLHVNVENWECFSIYVWIHIQVISQLHLKMILKYIFLPPFP